MRDKVVVTWMDGLEKEYVDFPQTRVSDGVLHIYEYTGVVRSPKAQWHLPTANIRVWTVVEMNE